MGTVTRAAGVGGRSYLTAEPGARWARLPRSLAPPPEASHRGRACPALCLSLRAGQGVSMWLSFRAAHPPPPLPFCVVGEDECATLPGAGPSPTPSEEGGWLGDLTAGSSCPRPWAFGSRPSSVLSPPWCDRTPRAGDSGGAPSLEGVTLLLPSPHLLHCSGCPPASQPPAGRGTVAPVPRTTPEAGVAPGSQVPTKSVESQERGCTGPREAFGNLEQVN